MEYEEVSFPSQDRIWLKGWWIAAEDVGQTQGHAPVVVILHPFLGNRHGFSAQHQGWPRLFERDVDLLKTAHAFHQAGYAVLLFDFRSHGKSWRGLCGGGLTEDQDVMGAVDYAFQRVAQVTPAETPAVGVVGFGLGAAAALAAVGREKGGATVIRVFSADSAGGAGFLEIQPLNVKRLRFVVAVQPASQETLLRGYLRHKIGLPGWSLVPLVSYLCQRRGGFPLGVKSLLKFVREVHIPVFYIQGRADASNDPGEAKRIYEATPGEKQICWIEGPRELLETYADIAQHPERLLAFAAQHID
jgi:pimeloyl-ACP methyl ester carboxylesterase